MKHIRNVWPAVAVLVVAVCAPAWGADPLDYLYQDPGVSHDSFAYNAGTGDMGGIARRGRHAGELVDGTAERAYVSFAGPGDGYLDYTELFDFQFEFNISAAGAGPDERLMLGLWYSPADAEASNPNHYKAWANRQHMVGVNIDHTLGTLTFAIFFGNGGNWLGKSESIDVTGVDSLATDTDYRVVAHYDYVQYGAEPKDGYGQLYGEIYAWEGGAWVLKWSLPQEVIIGGPHDVAWVDYSDDTPNRTFLQLSTMGVGNETWGTVRNDGPTFTSDNWYLGYGAEVWVEEDFETVGPGDVDGNGVVDGLDLTAVLTAWETEPGDPLWNEAADLDDNNIVDGLDLTEVISNWTVASAAAPPEAAASDTGEKPGRGNGRGKGNVNKK